MIDASPHICTPATIWIMCRVIKASIIFSTSGATLTGLQSVHFDKVFSVRLSTKWGHQQGRDLAGFNSAGMEPTLACSISALSTTTPWLRGFISQEFGTAACEEPVLISDRCSSYKDGVNSLGHSVVPVPDQYPKAYPQAEGSETPSWAAGAPKQLSFCSSLVHTGW